MKVIVYGGSFNPISKTHLEFAQKAISLLGANHLIFVPTGDPYTKSDLALARYRVKMLERLISAQKLDNMSVCTYEADNKEFQVRSLQTLDYIKTLFAIDTEIYFLIGADNAYQLKTWYKWQELISKYKLIIGARSETVSELKEELFNIVPELFVSRNVFFMEKIIGPSATQIRNRLKTGDPCSDVLDPEVLDLIIKYNLYGYNDNRQKGDS